MQLLIFYELVFAHSRYCIIQRASAISACFFVCLKWSNGQILDQVQNGNTSLKASTQVHTRKIHTENFYRYSGLLLRMN